jgi:fatty-acyl-CoA synthase
VTQKQFKKSNYIDILESIAPELKDSKAHSVSLKSLPSLKHLILMDESCHPGFHNFSDLYSLHDSSHVNQLQRRMEKADPDDPINIQVQETI